MTYAFLNPWLWLGAVAVGAPLWLHLRRRTETNAFKFSAVRFLDDQPMPRQSPRWLRQWLLFLLRVAAVLLLAGAFARPFDPTVESVVVKESRVYVLDNTLSHQTNGAFTKAQERIAGEIAAMGRETIAAVVELAAQPRVVAAFGDDKNQAAEKVLGLTPSNQRGSFLAAIRLANTLLTGSLGVNHRLVFCTDNQANQWSEGTSSPPFLQDVEVEVRGPEPPSPADNLSLAEPEAQRIFLGDKSLINFSVRLSHQGQARNVRVMLRGNGQIIFDRSVDLDQKPEDILLQAEWEADSRLWIRGEVAIEGTPDGLVGDNRVFFSVAPVKEGRLALLAQSPYLQTALSPEVMRGQWATRVLDPARLQEELVADQEEDVLVIESHYLQSADARKFLSKCLANGRGVILMVDKTTPVVNGFLRDLGFDASGNPPGAAGRPAKVQYFAAHHPVFHPFLSPDYGNLTEIQVQQRASLTAKDAMPLLLSETGEPLFFRDTRHKGALYVSTFGFDRVDTNWPVHLTFIPFLDLCLQNARPEDPTPSTYEPGEIASLTFPAGSKIREVELSANSKVLQRVPVAAGSAQLRMPEEPGCYTLSYDAGTEPVKIFSVNPSPKESRLAAESDPAVVKTWKLDAAESRKAGVVHLPSLSRSAILQQRIWWLLLIAGVAALLLETFWTSFRRLSL